MTKKGKEFKEGYPEDWDIQEDLVLKDPSEKLKVWKPEDPGEKKIGKLIAITKTKFNRILRMGTEEGTVNIPISTHLADVDFDRYIGRKFLFVFTGKVGRDCRLFKVVLLKD